MPIHSLLLSNDRFALLVAYHMFKMRPGLMPLAHVPAHSNLREEAHEESLFEGENCMHIAIMNRREALACRMIHLAYDQKLPHALKDSASLKQLCLSQARGSFFAMSDKAKKPLACCAPPSLHYAKHEPRCHLTHASLAPLALFGPQ